MNISSIGSSYPSGSAAARPDAGLDEKIRSLEQRLQTLQEEKQKAVQNKDEEKRKKLEKQIRKIEEQLRQLKQQEKKKTGENLQDASGSPGAVESPSGPAASVDTYA